MSKSAREGLSNPREVEVKEGEWKDIDTQGSLFTRGIQTCIGISIYSPDEAKALLGHFNSESLIIDEHLKMNLAASRYIKARNNVRLWVGGGEMLTLDLLNDHPKNTQQDIDFANTETRLFMSEVMSMMEAWTNKGASLSQAWLPTTGSIDYSINVESGKEVVTIQHQTPPNVPK